MFFFVWFLIPETKGLSLEKMDDLFGVTEIVDKKLQDDEMAHQRSDSTENGTTIGQEKNVTRTEHREATA
ncbi:hypothetical protein PVAG01_00484 [Phlyctema vagabunda]|uniref:Uncharacterized protein n=1 Tax=Phlyctema vagabunda TaxID=108571 RepID=A0ABR4PUE2_9HELO